MRNKKTTSNKEEKLNENNQNSKIWDRYIMYRRIGMIGGTGPQGQGLSLRWGLSGESLIMGSRDQEKADRISKQVNEKLGKDLIIPRTNDVCVKEADIILLTVPFDYAVSTLKPLLKYFNKDKILVDVTVPLKPFEKGKMVDLIQNLELESRSATELIRKIVPKEIAVVGAFKTLSNTTLQDIDRLPILNQDVFIFGSDKESKHVIKEKAKLIKNLNPVDSGGILSARHIEHFTAFLIGLNMRYKSHDCGFKVTGLPGKDW